PSLPLSFSFSLSLGHTHTLSPPLHPSLPLSLSPSLPPSLHLSLSPSLPPWACNGVCRWRLISGFILSDSADSISDSHTHTHTHTHTLKDYYRHVRYAWK